MKDILAVKMLCQKCLPRDAAQESLGIIIWEQWMSVQMFIAIHLTVVKISSENHAANIAKMLK